MRMSAAGTNDSTDAKTQNSFRCFNRTVIITVDRKTAGMPTGTGQSVELETGNKIIIKIWCNGVVFFDK